MRIKKAITLLLSVLFIVGVIAVPASAAGVGGESAVPYGPMCDACGDRTITSYTSWSSYVWVTDSNGNIVTVSCTHDYDHGVDYRLVSYRIKTIICESCTYTYRKQESRYSYECHGYN